MLYYIANQDELYHHGILGQKWGVRRYQNEDGTLTEAGKRRYGYNLDLSDRSRSNIAKIRKGEAQRRLDYAKMHSKDNPYRVAELRGRVRSANRTVRDSKQYDRGAKLAAKGNTIIGNKSKAFLVNMGAYAGSKVIAYALATRINAIAPNDPRYAAVGKMLTTAGSIALGTIAGAYNVKQYYNNAALRSYYNGRISGASTIKSVGSSEYKDRVEKSKKN